MYTRIFPVLNIFTHQSFRLQFSTCKPDSSAEHTIRRDGIDVRLQQYNAILSPFFYSFYLKIMKTIL